MKRNSLLRDEILVALSHSPAIVTDLTDDLDRYQASISRTVKGMIGDGLVVRDERALRLTEAGKAKAAGTVVIKVVPKPEYIWVDDDLAMIRCSCRNEMVLEAGEIVACQKCNRRYRLQTQIWVEEVKEG